MKKICLLAISFMMALSAPLSAQYVSIGTSTYSSSTYFPYGIDYKYSTMQSIYTAAEMGGAKKIETIAYQVRSTGALLTDKVEIYMGHTTKSYFSSDYNFENVSGMTLVYSGSPTLAASTGWEEFTLTTPFAYNGTSNLVVVVAKQASSYNDNGSYYYSSTSNAQCLYRVSHGTQSYGDATNYSNFKTSTGRANVRFGYEPDLRQDGIGYMLTSDTEASVARCTATTGAVTIPATVTKDGKTYSVTSIGEYAFYGCSGLTSLTIPSSVTSIGSSAFYGCTGKLTVNCNIGSASRSSEGWFYGSEFSSVEISKDVTSIGNYAFYGCSGLTSISIPSSVTSIGSSAFYGCTGKLTVNCNIGSASLREYGRFYDSKFSSIEIGKDVTSIGNYAFYGNNNIQSLTIGSGVTTIGSDAFNYRPTKTIWLTNTPPSGYAQASGTVNYVSNNNFTSLSNTKVYAYLSSMFENKGVKYVPDNPSERTCDAIDYTYLPQDSIVTIGKTVSYRNISMTVKAINDYLAYDNNIIKELTIEADCNTNQYAFYGNSKLQKVNLSNTGNIGSSAFYGCSQLSTCTIGDAVAAVGDNAFYSCSSLPAIQLGKNIKTIGSGAFWYCSKLQEIAIPDATTTLGTSCFSGCTSLKKADTGDGITAIPSYAFSGCSALETISVGGGVKSIDTYAFQNCSALADIAIPSNVNKIDDYAFYGCKKLADVVIADRKEALTLGCNYNYYNSSTPLFSDCPLDSLYIGGKISYNTSSSYGYSPFYRNTSLRTVVITNEETEIYPNEFYGCTNLQNVKIGDGVKKIGDYAFSGCSSLEEFTFGTGLQSIGKEGFSDCTALKSLASKATTPPACGTQALDDVNKWDCTLYVPQANTAAYQAADQWKDFFFVSTIEGSNLEGDEEFEGVHRVIADGVMFSNTLTRDYDTISYVRNFTTHDWEAIYLPFSMSYDDWKDNYEVARINAFYQYDDDEDGKIDRSVLQAIKVKSGDTRANYPYLIRAKVPEEKSFNLYNKTVYTSKVNSTDCSTIDTKFTFVGIYTSVSGSALANKTAYAMEEGALKQVTAAMSIPACRWYIEVEGRTADSPANAPVMRVLVSEDEESMETDLKAIETLTEVETATYLMDGRRATDRMPQGMYVKSGKKFIQK